MDKKRGVALALLLLASLGLGSELMSAGDGLFSAREQRHTEKDGDDHAEEGAEHAEADGEHAEEGRLTLSEAQIAAAGIELSQAAPRTLGKRISLAGEIRLDEDRTAHVFPRTSGVVESVRVNLGQTVKQ